MVSNLKTISMSSSKLLLAAKALSTDPSSPNLKNQLAAAARWPMFLSSLSSLLIYLLYFFWTVYLSYLLNLCAFYVDRAVTDSINHLITMCTQQAPGQKECDNALRELEVTTIKLFTMLLLLLLLPQVMLLQNTHTWTVYYMSYDKIGVSVESCHAVQFMD